MSDQATPTAAASGILANAAGQAERELLAAMRMGVAVMANGTAAHLVSVAIQHTQHQLGALLRAAAVHGMSAELAAEVGGRIDHALRSAATVNFAPMTFSIARDESGRVTMGGLFDINSFSLAFKGAYSSSSSTEGLKPRMLSFKSTAFDLPTPQIVIPPPQIIVNNHVRPATRQQVTRDTNGEIAEIITTAD